MIYKFCLRNVTCNAAFNICTYNCNGINDNNNKKKKTKKKKVEEEEKV